MATGDSEMASDEFSDFQCFTCTGKVAVKYCVECQGYCCQSCMDTHLRFPALKSHTLLDPSTGKVEGSLISLPTQRCSIHSIKLVDMYCKDHDDVGCTTCMALKHRYFDN
jgi:tripartite motif-containing protein 2/3